MGDKMKTAKEVKKCDDFTGDARLYELSEPVTCGAGETKYVVVSATNAFYSGPETYIFAANEQGEVVDWCELGGSFRGGLDHAEALQGAGFEIL